MRFYLILVLSLLTGLSLTACDGQATDPQADTDSLRISLTTEPDPPQSGLVDLTISVTDAHGRPLTEADLFIIADHTEMRGMTLTETAAAQGDGRYSITAEFAHGGNWRVTVQVNRDGANVALEDFDLAVR
jgi:hypothetical protein